ncbi:MAG: hypothetical protein DRN17_04565 [Thermoplasmata archaeon]|nr:MAG: hypothetical protein DRN17_04565 [Thermoplasmata archaeon]
MTAPKMGTHDNKKKYRFLRAMEISPKDDAFHGNINLLDVEWWYFDAILENGYSVHMGVRIYHLGNSGIVQSRITVYREGKSVVEAVKTDLYSNTNISSEIPLIEINGRPVIEFDQKHYKKTGRWQYHLSLHIDNHAINLTFDGMTPGWKVETSDTCWAVALPKAKVQGTIKVNGQEFRVKGVGYHDHNWGYPPPLPVSLNYQGWFWGRIHFDTMGITWARVMMGEKEDLLAVVNRDSYDPKQGVFYSIPPDNIMLETGGFVKNRWQQIPTEFELQIKDVVPGCENLNADVQMKTIDVHYSRIFTFHYWRYHMQASGEITADGTTERLHGKPQIIEFLCIK